MSIEMRKLLEAAEQLNEAYIEYRDPEGRFQVIYDFPRGYWAVGKNDYVQDISGESFDDLDDAIEHAEICLGISDDEREDYTLYGIDEDFAEQPVPYDDFYMGSILDREEMPAIPMRLKALDDVPMLYMRKGDEMWVKPTNIMGEVYSEENGLTYDWDSIFHMYQRGMLEIIPDENEFNEPGEMEPYVEESTEELVESDSDVDQVFSNLQRELTSVAMKAQQAASFIKRMHPEEREKYNLAVDIEMELDVLRKRVFDAR